MTDLNRVSGSNRLLLSTWKAQRYPWFIALLCVMLVIKFMPLFHLVSLDSARQSKVKKSFNPQAFVDKLWPTLVNKDLNQAIAVEDLINALEQDPKGAATRYGHTLGLGTHAAFFVYGSGNVIAIEEDTVLLKLPENTKVHILIETGPIFGNAIRDGSGLLNISEFTNTQEFNAISSEINRRVEQEVFPQLKDNMRIDRTIYFIGGIESFDEKALTLVPTHVEFL